MLLAQSKQIYEFASIVTIISSLILFFTVLDQFLILAFYLFTIKVTAILLLNTHLSYLPLIFNLGISNNNKIMLTQTKWNFCLQPVL